MKNLFIIICLITFYFASGQTKNPLDDGRKIRIPVVFHVIYNSEKENVPDSLILNELKDLNLDFSAKNDMSLLVDEFKSIVGNPNIEFYLLDTLLQTSGIKGVRRVFYKNAKNQDALMINGVNCLNVFIGTGGNNAPFIGARNGSAVNRVNLNYEDIGKHTHGSTHECGHWLGLFHIFGPVGNSSWWNRNFRSNNDEINDTPEQTGATAICYTITSRCPCPPNRTLYKGHKTLYNNFMDYNPCRCMFSAGQVTHIRNKIIEDRRKLFDDSK